jgi:hypothetical protein
VNDDGTGQVFEHSDHPCDTVREGGGEKGRGPWKVRVEVGFPLIRLTTSPGRRPVQVLGLWMKPTTAGVPEWVNQQEGETTKDPPGLSEGRRVRPRVGEVKSREVSRRLSTIPRKALTEVSSTAWGMRTRAER